MNATDIICIIVIVIILIPAVLSTVKHLKGEGECCGGPKEKSVKKKIKGTKLKELTVSIEGMHCTNCKNRIEKNLDLLDGVVAKVNLEKKQAKVSLYSDVSAELIRETIEKLDFKVTDIREI